MSNLTETEIQAHFLQQDAEIVRELTQSLGHQAGCCITTFGCQMNAHDSEKISGMLAEMGFREVPEDEADFIIYNTCTVRENADLRVYGRLGVLNGLRHKRPGLKIALCGCMMQEKHVIEKLKKSYSFVNLIFGTHNLAHFPELIYRMYQEKGPVIEILEQDTGSAEELPRIRHFSFKSGVNIMYGCNNFCTYCIVPYVRGRERSRKKEDILNEISQLAADGVIEIMLLGQNVNSYGKNLDEPVSFAELLKEAADIPGIERVRFMTSHPKDLSDELIEVMASNPRICRHLHLPVQSGSTELLRKMNRRYTREAYLELVSKIRRAIPDISLTTDVIVGFPGETEEDFADTLSLVEECGFDSVFTFEYSRRTGTPAAVMADQVPEAVVKDRFKRLLETVRVTGEKAVRRFEGQTVDVLVEGKNREEGLLTGRLSQNLLVHFPGDEDLIGSVIPVRLNECKGFYYLGSRA